MKVHIEPEIIGTILGLPISSSLLLAWIAAILLVGIGIFVVHSLQLVPGKVQGVAEVTIEGIFGFMESITGSREKAKEFFPLIASFFLFILFMNWIGIFPGIGSVGFYQQVDGHSVFTPFFRPPASELNTTLALALVSVIITQIYGIRKLGLWAHLGKFFVFGKGPLNFFVGLLELLGEFTKIVSFSFRLFGNMFAGKVMLVIIMALIPLVVPVPFLALELLIGFLQALVFAALTLIFLSFATETAMAH
ncbi:MAG: F0F1 ATP synthase subunit A [bacterium]|nr:F0F1 ATP synthase subunit A [bacterium]